LPPERGGGIRGWRDQWRAATPSQTHSSRQKTLLVLPRTLSGERRRGRCFANLRNQVLSLAGGRRSSSGERPRGSCEAGSLRVPHRWTDPRVEEEHRALAGLPSQSLASAHNPSGKQDLRKARPQESKTSGKQDLRKARPQESKTSGKPKQTRTDDSRPRRGRSWCLGGEDGAGARRSSQRRSSQAEALIAGGGAHRRRRRSSQAEALIAGERTGASAGGCGVSRPLVGRSKRGHPSARAGTTRVRKESPG